jgi:hypothetical protein
MDARDETRADPPARGAPDSQQLLTALTTEHFTLQGARTQTIAESSARASIYVFSVSSTLVALGFIAQISAVGDIFNTFALTVLPTLYFLGVVTYIRLVESGAEDYRYGMAINRIRHYYKEIAGDRADLFLLSGHDDGKGVFANMGIPFDDDRTPIFAFSTAIAVLNGVVGGGAVAIALGALANASLGLAAGIGAVAALASVVGWIAYADRLLDARAAADKPIFPTPASS